MLSIIIPAHNEERELPHTLDVVFAAARELERPFELIVVNDSSTDRTADIAREKGARVVDVQHRQIGPTRNAGARAATGDTLLFVDADTYPTAQNFRAALAAVEGGAIAAGARVLPDTLPPHLLGRAAMHAFTFVYFGLRLVAGCFICIRKADFERVGGFDERYFAGEETDLSWRLKRLGRIAIIAEPVISSGRKFRTHGPGTFLKLIGRVMLGGRKAVQRREGLDLWYDGKREQ